MLELIDEAEVALLLRMHQEATLGRMISGLIHEIRNPLNSISNSTQLLEERGEQEALRSKLLPVIARSSARIQRLLEVLELHRADQHAGPIELHRALASCMEVLVYAARYVEYHPSGVNAAVFVDGSPHVIWSVLLSLLEDALGSGAKNLWVRSQGDDTHHFLVIEYDGSRKDSDDSQNASLATDLSRILVQQQGGELERSARELGGSCVTLTLHKTRSGSNDQDSLR